MNTNYRNLILVNNSLTIITNSGDCLMKNPCSQEDLQNIKNAQSEEEIYSLVMSEEFKEQKEKEIFEKEKLQNQLNKIKLLEEIGDFEFKDNKVYLLGINRALPEFIVNKFIDILDKGNWELGFGYKEVESTSTEYEAFKRFTLWCIAAPRPQVLDRLFPFLEKYGLKLSKEGFFFVIRNVVTVEGTNNPLADFITNEFLRIQSKKKGTGNYNVYQDLEKFDFFSDGKGRSSQELAEDTGRNQFKIIGNLKELYYNLSTNEEVKYTDNYTKSWDFRINKWVKKDPSEIEWDDVNCSDNGGFHFSLDSTGLCGDKSMLIAINPMHVTSIGTYKGTSWAFLPIMATNKEEAKKILLDQTFDSFELSFEQFEEGINGDLEETIKQGYVDAIHRDEFRIPEITNKDVKIIVQNLEIIKEELKDRVVEIN